MQKFFLVEQPPISSKYRLLVDDINDYGTFAITTDIEKVLYNRRVLGSELSIHLETYTALSSKGMTTALPLGRFITIWEISKDEKMQRITFVDYDTNVPFREVSKQHGGGFSDALYDSFEQIQAKMKADFRESDDQIELVVVSE